MNNSKSILQKPNPNTGWANPEFIKPAFDQTVWDNGYEVSLERAVRCPCCKGGDALIDCQNCFGTGYFYVNAISTRALITGINVTNRYMRWSEELLGTIAVTVIASDKNNLSWYDRITIHNEWSYYSEVLTVREIGSQRFVFTTYHPVDILGIYQYVSSVEPLKMVSSDNFIVSDKNGYCVLLGDNVDIQAGETLSIYYKHEPEFHVIDIPHEIRSDWETAQGGKDKIYLPIQAIGRRSHLIAIEKPNFDGTGVQINENMKYGG